MCLFKNRSTGGILILLSLLLPLYGVKALPAEKADHPSYILVAGINKSKVFRGKLCNVLGHDTNRRRRRRQCFVTRPTTHDRRSIQSQLDHSQAERERGTEGRLLLETRRLSPNRQVVRSHLHSPIHLYNMTFPLLISICFYARLLIHNKPAGSLSCYKLRVGPNPSVERLT